jgi:L-rhamnose isomerase
MKKQHKQQTAHSSQTLKQQYDFARKSYAQMGVDADAAIQQAMERPISLHCWQADDVAGLEHKQGVTDGGGIMATGNYPGRARNGDEIRQDLATVMRLLPGVCRVNLHASYAETESAAVDRDALEVAHFSRWIAWAKAQKIGLDFNTTFFAHPKAADGYTLSHADPAIRKFWIRHAIACRKIAQAMGQATGSPCLLNHWLPDGGKDATADRWSPRQRLMESLDEILSPRLRINNQWCMDCVEGKLFGLGSEDYVVGSVEFYSQYALKRGILLCLDMGHFHPTETIHDKLSAFLQFHKKIVLHVSRAMRWDSDHVVIFNDDLRAVFQELVRGDVLSRAIVALDFFDASINRIAAYVIGARATRQAMLYALLEPVLELKRLATEGRHAQKLALVEQMKAMPFSAVWDMLCHRANVPVAQDWVGEMEKYEADVLSQR